MQARKFTHHFRDSEIEDLFQRAMEAEGLIFKGKDTPIRMDGKKHYVCVSNRSKGNHNSRSGWYIGHLGDFPCGTFGWYHGKQPLFKWSLYQHIKDNNGGKIQYEVLSEQEAADKEKQRAREERRRQQEIKDQFNLSKALSIIEWERAYNLTTHPYIESKNFSIEECQPYCRIFNRHPYTKPEIEKILDQHFPEYNKPSSIRKLLDYQAENLEFRGFNILIRGYLLDNTPQSLQLIFDKKNKSGKNKLFLKGLNKHKTSLCIGKPIDPEKPPTHVIICEGFATGISLSRITQNKIPILVAWDSGNMRAVAIEVRQSHPATKIYSANDNDHTKPEQNAGVLGGLKVCHAVGGYQVTPPFDSCNPAHEPLSDWNDFDATHSPTDTYNIFRSIFRSAEYIPARFEEYEELFRYGTPFKVDSVFERVIESPEFKKFWIAAMNLVFRGIQNCNYSYEHCIELLNTELNQVEDIYGPHTWDRTYDLKSELRIMDSICRFTFNIHTSSNFIMSDQAPFEELFSVIKPINEEFNNTRTLDVVTSIISGKYGDELANTILTHHFESTNYFNKTQSEWIKDVLDELSEIKPLFNTFPYLACLKEIDYWTIGNSHERVKTAAKLIQSAQLSEPPSDQTHELGKQIMGAIQQLFLNPTNERKLDIEKLINHANKDNISLNINLNLLT